MNRRSFFGLGGKVALAVGAASLTTHIGVEKVKQLAQPTRSKHKIIDWQVTYDRGQDRAAVTRSMALASGFYPPEETNWDGKIYHRYWISPNGYSAFYRRDS